MKMIKEIVCPQCLKELKGNDKEVECENRHKYPVENGVPLLFYKKGMDKQLGVKKLFNETPYGLVGAADAYKNHKKISIKTIQKDPWYIKEKNIKGKNILEAGCGGGHLFTELYFNGAKVVGLDQTPNSLFEIKKLFKNKKVDLVNGNIEHLPFKNESFDIVTSMGVIHHTPNTQKALCELSRVMKNDGNMWIMVYHKISAWNYIKNTLRWSCKRSKLLYNTILKVTPIFMGNTKGQSNIETVFRDNIVNPITKSYSLREMRKMAKHCGLRITYYNRHELVELYSLGRGVYKSKLMRPIEKRFGWFLTMKLEKVKSKPFKQKKNNINKFKR